MSELSEEEMKEINKDTEEKIKDLLLDYNRKIEALYKLFKEEKEKNKGLQTYMKEYLIPKSTINLVYISKDKIKEKIEEVQNREYNMAFIISNEELKQEIIDSLQELLQ